MSTIDRQGRWGIMPIIIFALLMGFACLVGYGILWIPLLQLAHRFFAIGQDHHLLYLAVTQITFLLALVLLALLIERIMKVKKGVATSRKGDKTILERLAGPPDRHNYNWQGGFSIFTFAILNVVRIMREISALQLCKVFFRKFASPDTDVTSTRPNVPPWFQEVYMLIWCAFLLVQFFIGDVNDVCYASIFCFLDVYFIVESMTWILYYSVFRRFFEENYSVYHVLEHLPTILFMIPLQAMAYALACRHDGHLTSTIVSNIGFQNNILPVLLGQASENYVVFSIMGFIYSAIVISMIISSFPVERIKVGVPETFIIGAGDVVRKRLYGALCRNRRIGRPEDIQVYTKEFDEEIRATIKTQDDEIKIPNIKSIYQLIMHTKKNGVAWIETPSDTHLFYLDLLKDAAAFIAVEKPMVCSKSDLSLVKDIISSEYRKKIFFLSYYLLEKALVLTFLKRPNKFYLKYIEESSKHPRIAPDKFYQAYLELGRLKSVDVEIIEDEDSRDLPNGGQLIETFVHHCLIASLFAGMPNTWRVDCYKKSESPNRAKISLNATGECGEKIRLLLIKGFDGKYRRKKQGATLVFENGKIKANFDEKFATIYDRDHSIAALLKIKQNYRGVRAKKENQGSGKKDDVQKFSYDIQCDMVYECYFNQLDPSRIDGLYHQIEVLEWLLALHKGGSK